MEGGAMNWRAHLCSAQGCHEETVADLVLSERQQRPDGSRVAQSRIMRKHLYLCKTHYEMMKSFMDTFEKQGGN